MSGIAALILGIISLIAYRVLSGMVDDEIRGQLDRIPCFILLLARRRVPKELRVCLHDEEWQPELYHILHRAEGRPISRLLMGTMFALGILRAARRIGLQRARLAAPEIELRRLVSLSTVANALGNIVTTSIGYALIFTFGFATSVAFITVLGISNPLLWWPMKVVLYLVFGPPIGIGFGIVATIGFRVTFKRLVVPPPMKLENPVASSRSVRALAAIATFSAATTKKLRLPGAIACAIWSTGIALGIFARLSILHVTSQLLVVLFAIAVMGALRLFIVAPLQWLYLRRHLRITQSRNRRGK